MWAGGLLTRIEGGLLTGIVGGLLTEIVGGLLTGIVGGLLTRIGHHMGWGGWVWAGSFLTRIDYLPSQMIIFLKNKFYLSLSIQLGNFLFTFLFYVFLLIVFTTFSSQIVTLIVPGLVFGDIIVDFV